MQLTELLIEQKRVELVSEAVTILQELSNDLYPGEVYKTRTKIPRRRRGLISFKRSVPSTASPHDKGRFDPIFIIGYEVDSADVFFEIWYDANLRKFIVFDKYGNPVSRDRSKIRRAMDDLSDVVSAYLNRQADVDYEDEIDRQLDTAKQRQLSTRIRMQDWVEQVDDPLEENVTTRMMLGSELNVDVEEYKSTRMEQNEVSRFFRRVLGGKPVSSPRDFTDYGLPFGGLKKKWDQLAGNDKAATFVTGYTLADRIDVEVWYVKDTRSGRDKFYVFDLTGLELVTTARTMKDAIKAIADLIQVPVDYGVPEDDVPNHRKRNRANW